MLQGHDRVKVNLLARSVAIGLLLAQSAGLLHLALAPHQLCREHGEMVEPGPAADAIDQAAEADLAPTAALRDGGESRWADAGHEHCAVAVLHREQAPAPWRTLVPVAVVAVDAPRLEPRESPPARIAGWQVAPKQGPPAAA